MTNVKRREVTARPPLFFLPACLPSSCMLLVTVSFRYVGGATRCAHLLLSIHFTIFVGIGQKEYVHLERHIMAVAAPFNIHSFK